MTSKCWAKQKRENKRSDSAYSVSFSVSENHIVLDSGASLHCTSNRSLFKGLTQNCDEHSVQLAGKNSKLQVTEYGILKIPNENRIFVVQNVAFIPDLNGTFLSLMCFFNLGHNLKFSGSSGELFYYEFCIVFKNMNNVCCVDFVRNKEKLDKKRNIDFDSIHKRLLHPSDIFLKKTIESCNDLTLKQPSKAQTCLTCLQCKVTRDSIRIKSKRASCLLEAVYMDIKGPILKGFGNAKYVLSFVDEYSRYAVSYFINSKSEVPEMLKKFIIKSNHETGKKSKLFILIMHKNFVRAHLIL